MLEKKIRRIKVKNWGNIILELQLMSFNYFDIIVKLLSIDVNIVLTYSIK